MPSWRDGPAKRALTEFLVEVTQGESALAVSERVAAFDNDGTMACERPHTTLSEFLAACTQGQGPQAPPASGHEVLRELAELFQGQTTAQYDLAARAFLREAVHLRFQRPYPLLTFQPMLELVDVLHALEFSVFMCTDSSRDFMRVMAGPAYGLRREHVIGSEVQLTAVNGQLVRTATLEQLDDGPGKTVHLWDRAGVMPVLAAGNAAGDIEMLEAARFAMVVHHDDPTREYAYDDPRLLAKAREHDWTIVSMKTDFVDLWPAARGKEAL
nr:haloacid dehalogenase-like hydrolase [Pedococcus badiiscoriae]